MNEHEADRIAAAVNMLRPDWPVTSIRTTLARPELMSRPRRDVAVALTWVACDGDTKTPARVTAQGAWWKAALVEEAEATWVPPRASEACSRCNRYVGACICAIPTADGHDEQPERPRGYSTAERVPATEAFRAARLALKAEPEPTTDTKESV